jgi:site-specific recombinase XerD
MTCTGIEINDCLEDYMAQTRHYSTQTTYVYKLVMRRFAGFVGPDIGIDEITPQDIVKFIAPHSNSAATYNCTLAGLKSFFAWAQDQYGFANPTARLYQIPQRHASQVRVLTIREYKALLAAGGGHCGIAVFLCNTGLRVGEFLSLEADQIDLGKKVLRVLGKGARMRFVPINARAAQIVRTYGMLNKHDGMAYARNSIRHMLHIAAGQARIQPFNPHACRHFFATELISRGVPIQSVSRLLGHASIELTVSKYYHPDSFGNVDVLDTI